MEKDLGHFKVGRRQEESIDWRPILVPLDQSSFFLFSQSKWFRHLASHIIPPDARWFCSESNELADRWLWKQRGRSIENGDYVCRGRLMGNRQHFGIDLRQNHEIDWTESRIENDCIAVWLHWQRTDWLDWVLMEIEFLLAFLQTEFINGECEVFTTKQTSAVRRFEISPDQNLETWNWFFPFRGMRNSNTIPAIGIWELYLKTAISSPPL